jgi:uncharacterized Zn finger protein
MKNLCTCPNCRAPAMTAWRRDPTVITSGNTHVSVCRECGAVEKRSMAPHRPGPLRNELLTHQLRCA